MAASAFILSCQAWNKYDPKIFAGRAAPMAVNYYLLNSASRGEFQDAASYLGLNISIAKPRSSSLWFQRYVGFFQVYIWSIVIASLLKFLSFFSMAHSLPKYKASLSKLARYLDPAEDR